MIEFREVSRTYDRLGRRPVRAVEEISLRIDAGQVVGLAGPNGAGKSTLIAMLLGYLAPSRGDVRIAGRAPRDYIERNGIGYLSELVAIEPRWRAREALVRYATLAGIPDAGLDATVDGVIARLGLEEHRDKRIKALSKGNLQRLGLAQALLRDDDVLVLDEPTHGLDPVWTQRFRDIVQELRRPGRAMFIASHNLDELQRVADRVAIIDAGRLQRMVDVRGGAPHGGHASYRLMVAEGAAHVRSAFPDAAHVAGAEWSLVPMSLEALNEGIARFIALGGRIAAVTPARSALEEEFRAAVRTDREERE